LRNGWHKNSGHYRIVWNSYHRMCSRYQVLRNGWHKNSGRNRIVWNSCHRMCGRYQVLRNGWHKNSGRSRIVWNSCHRMCSRYQVLRNGWYKNSGHYRIVRIARRRLVQDNVPFLTSTVCIRRPFFEQIPNAVYFTSLLPAHDDSRRFGGYCFFNIGDAFEMLAPIHQTTPLLASEVSIFIDTAIALDTPSRLPSNCHQLLSASRSREAPTAQQCCSKTDRSGTSDPG